MINAKILIVYVARKSDICLFIKKILSVREAWKLQDSEQGIEVYSYFSCHIKYQY